MRKQFEIYIIILIIALGSFGLAYRPLFPVVKATYVEGPITKDTLWTLVDSPIVVSKDVTVQTGVTLRIEPGVEVRLGENLAIVVLGNLYANGNNKTITFTSNRLQPAPGDWLGVVFQGTGISTLMNCSITYAYNGILAEDCSVTIDDSTIGYCLQNGINATNMNQLTVRNTQILENNGANGISVTGNGHVSIENSTIMANMNGILLTGSQTSGVNITQNRIYANAQNGIMIDASTHLDISITSNIVSANNTRGFYVSTPTNTSGYIHDNSVSNNHIGFFYEEGNHSVSYNDIYNNDFGMDVGSGPVIVNAEHNYWGSPDGPYNEWLNPEGRGNEVGGNGVNLDFMFWLTEQAGYINTPPTAKLLTDKTSVNYGQDVMFIASNSYDEGHIDWYKFDYGDGQTSGWTTLSITTHAYPFSLDVNYTATLTIVDDFGGSDTDTVIVNVRSGLGSLEVNTVVNASNPTVSSGENVAFTFIVISGSSPVQDANVTVFAVRGGNFSQLSGSTDANGIFATIFTAPYVTQETNVRVFARASKSGYADGASGAYLTVKPILSVEIQPASSTIKSEGTASVTVFVTSNGAPIQNAFVAVSSTIGTLTIETGFTDANGILSFNITAPYTPINLAATITANAKKDKYGDGIGQATIEIKPKILEITMAVEPYAVFSGANVNVTVHVEYEMSPIEGASVVMTSENGSFLQVEGLTDFGGSARFIWTAPQVNIQTSFWINASISAVGYDSRSYRMDLAVNPKTFNITMTVSSSRIESEETKTIAVYVGCIQDGTPVANASITMSASEGTVFAENQTTNSEGLFIFNYTAPRTAVTINATVTVAVARNGYASGAGQTEIRINPKSASEAGGGWPILTILLIAIPIIVVIIVAVLIKLKVIQFSSKEET